MRIAVALIFTTLLQGQTALSLSDAIHQAIAQHPLLRAGQARVEAAEGIRLQGSLRPNPRLFTQSENTRLWGPRGFSYPNDTDNFGYLSQVFESAGKRQRRVEYANTLVSRAQIESRVLELQIASRVASAYWAAAAASELRDLLRQDLARFDEIVAYHQNRVKEGASAEVDLLRVLIERDRIAINVRNAEQDAATAIVTLSREMGFDQPEALELKESLPSPVELTSPDVNAALANRPEVKLAQESIAVATASQRLQEANAKPDPEVLFGYKRTAGLDTLIGGLQINLPFANRNQGAIAAAAAERKVAEHSMQAAERQVRHEVVSAYAQAVARRRTLVESMVPMRSRADEVARIAQSAYREGGFDLLRVLDAERVRLDTTVAYYRALGEYQQSVTSLRLAMGELP